MCSRADERKRLRLATLAFLILAGPANAAGRAVFVPHGPLVILPKTHLGPHDLGVVVNEDDPRSVRIGRYYLSARHIPRANLIRIRFTPTAHDMSVPVFQRLEARLIERTPPWVQAYALAWTRPVRVGCMSITTAFAMGYDPAFCSSGCAPTKLDPYFNSDSTAPYLNFGVRPAMMLAGRSVRAVEELIDRGIESDGTQPDGTAYLVSTGDPARNGRAVEFPAIKRALEGVVRTRVVHARGIWNRRHVLFYFTGIPQVPGLDTNRFVPGAVGDNLTSFGGVLDGKTGQTNVLQWLAAGVTGSYGTVTEPCNFLAKFPDPAVFIGRYVSGESLIEAYWKSVAMPGQGIFVGEPLADPFGGYSVTYRNGVLAIRTRALPPGRYAILAGNSRHGSFHAVGSIRSRGGLQTITVRGAHGRVYRLVALPVR
ncbi:MAG: TIGR03790 family protein [Acidiferrobacteraceae bacterium]